MVTPNILSAIDATNYLGGLTPGLRYQEIRMIKCRAWVESPPPTLSQPGFGIVIVDAASGTTFQARPVSGATYAAVGMQFALETRQEVFPSNDPSLIMTIATDLATIPEAAAITFVVDVLCEFS